MKHLAVGLAAALGASLVVSPAHAQVMEPEAYPLSFGIAAGATIPVGNLGDVQSTGWHVEGLVDWTSPATPLGLRADITYNNLGGKTIDLPGQPTFETDSRNLFQLTGDAVWRFRPSTTATTNPWMPYILGGIGIYHIEGETVTSGITQSQTSSDNSTDFGLNLGGGVIFRLAGFSTFAEARYHTVFTSGDNANFFPFSFGVRFGGR